jgi:hypothetical protein
LGPRDCRDCATSFDLTLELVHGPDHELTRRRISEIQDLSCVCQGEQLSRLTAHIRGFKNQVARQFTLEAEGVLDRVRDPEVGIHRVVGVSGLASGSNTVGDSRSERTRYRGSDGLKGNRVDARETWEVQ